MFDLGDYRRTIFLAGVGRSGTTWLEEALNADNAFRTMFEPFHSGKIGLLNGWRYRQYLRPENDDPRFLQPARRILAGKIRHPWIDQFNRKMLPRRRIIKDIRTNLLLKWLKHHFPEIPVIVLLRHPCAVAASKIALHWQAHLEVFLDQDELVTDHLKPFLHEIRAAHQQSDEYSKHIFMWCIENLIPLRQFATGEIYVLFYEHLCTDYQSEMAKLFCYLHRKPPATAMQGQSRPSPLCRDGSAVLTTGNLLNSWRVLISSAQIRRCLDILKLFGLDALYGKQDLPLLTGDEALLLQHG